MDPITFDLARQVLDDQPFSAHLGARLTGFAVGTATIEIDIDDRHRQQFGYIHGGVIAYLVDNTATFAGGSVLGPEVLTGQITVDYLSAARDGTLHAQATVDHHTTRRALVTVRVTATDADGAETLVALGRGTIISIADPDDG